MQIKKQHLQAKQKRPCPECGTMLPMDAMDCPECGALLLDGTQDLDVLKQEQLMEQVSSNASDFFSENDGSAEEYPTWEHAMAAGQQEQVSYPAGGDFSSLFEPAPTYAPGDMFEDPSADDDFADADMAWDMEDDLGAFEVRVPEAEPTPSATFSSSIEEGPFGAADNGNAPSPQSRKMWHRAPQDAARRERMRASS